jgi:hypothetical protein
MKIANLLSGLRRRRRMKVMGKVWVRKIRAMTTVMNSTMSATPVRTQKMTLGPSTPASRCRRGCRWHSKASFLNARIAVWMASLRCIQLIIFGSNHHQHIFFSNPTNSLRPCFTVPISLYGIHKRYTSVCLAQTAAKCCIGIQHSLGPVVLWISTPLFG